MPFLISGSFFDSIIILSVARGLLGQNLSTKNSIPLEIKF